MISNAIPVSTQSHSGSSLSEEYFYRLYAWIRQVKPGMKRSDVEEILHQWAGGIQGPQVTIYHVSNSVKVEVTYDTWNGHADADNRVADDPRLFVALPAKSH